MKHILLALILSIFAFAVYAVPVTCPNCKGTGYEPGESKKMSNSLSSSRTPCSMCKGKKKVEPKISKVMGMELGAKYPDFQNIMPPGFMSCLETSCRQRLRYRKRYLNVWNRSLIYSD